MPVSRFGSFGAIDIAELPLPSVQKCQYTPARRLATVKVPSVGLLAVFVLEPPDEDRGAGHFGDGTAVSTRMRGQHR